MTLLDSSPARLPVHAAKGSLATSSHLDPQAGVESVKASPPGRRTPETVLTECFYCGKFTACPMDHGPGRCIPDIFAEDT